MLLADEATEALECGELDLPVLLSPIQRVTPFVNNQRHGSRSLGLNYVAYVSFYWENAQGSSSRVVMGVKISSSSFSIRL